MGPSMFSGHEELGSHLPGAIRRIVLKLVEGS